MPDKKLTSDAKWAIELDRGDGSSVEYYPIRSILIDGDKVRVAVFKGSTFEVDRTTIRKILVMRTVD